MGLETSRWQSSAAVVSVFNGDAPGADAGITGGFKVPRTACALRITVALTVESVLNLTCTDGTTPHKWGLNESTALTAGDLFTFTAGVRSTDDGLETGTDLTYDFEVETDGVVECLFVEIITGGVV